MPIRYYIETVPEPGAVISLDLERSHYLCRVMRIRTGDQVPGFDGKGNTFTATMLEANPKQARLTVQTMDTHTPAAPWSLAIGLSLVKGQAMDRAVQQATELGATHIWLFASERSNAKLKAGKSLNRKMMHLQKIVIGAAEQCGRVHLPRLAFSTLPDLLASDAAKLVLQPQSPALPTRLKQANWLLLVGPEGGWSEGELQQFNVSQVALHSLGSLILRAETVPAVALTLVKQALLNQPS